MNGPVSVRTKIGARPIVGLKMSPNRRRRETRGNPFLQPIDSVRAMHRNWPDSSEILIVPNHPLEGHALVDWRLNTWETSTGGNHRGGTPCSQFLT